jgi:hypothetical protein
VSIHLYDANDPIKTLGIQYQAIKAVVPDKPALIAEFGSGSNGEDVFTDPEGSPSSQFTIRGDLYWFWSPASYWWWDTYVDPLDLWKNEKGLTALIKGLDVAHMTPGASLWIAKATALTLTDTNHVLVGSHWMHIRSLAKPNFA